MIRLRESLDAGLRHPLYGPLLAILLGLILVLSILHTAEHGVEGMLLTCAIAAAVMLPLVVAIDTLARCTAPMPVAARGPPHPLRCRVARAAPPVPLAVPLRR